MTSYSDRLQWKNIQSSQINAQTDKLKLYSMPLTGGESVCRLFAAIPHLRRLKIHNGSKLVRWDGLGMVLWLTPHLTSLRFDHCHLKDDTLLAVLQGCSLELCDLRVKSSALPLKQRALRQELARFTNL